MRIGVIDLETGGLDNQKHGITQVAVIDGELYAENGRVCFGTRSIFHELVTPDGCFTYEQQALDYQGMTLERMKAEGSNVCSMLTRLSVFMDPIVASGVGRVWAQEDTFDFGFITAAIGHERQFGNNDPRTRSWVKPRSDWNCSKRLARLCRTLGLLDAEGDSLEPVCKALGIARPKMSELKPVQDCWMTGQVIAALLTNLGMAGHPYYLNR